MQKTCESKYCFYNTPRENAKIDQISCPLCMQAQYCSKRCRDLDWTQNHKISCSSFLEQQRIEKQRSQSVNDTMDSISTLKSIRRKIEEFELIQNGRQADLGKGSYGQVKLVKDKTNQKEYAMKIMHKKQIFEYCTVENLKREIKIQRKLVFPYIIKLFHYFEDKENVYLILEYAENGSLFSYLRKRRKLPEQEAFVYFFQTCLGIDYLHKNNILHRDLKPENLLLDKEGNIKICDFGWSAETPNQYAKRTTFCGTCEYMAPEMIQNKPHDHTLDIWCLGILLFELLHGHAPFRGSNENEICKAIVQFKQLNIDNSLTNDAKDLIKNILKYKPQDRYTMQQVFEHPWMISNSKHYKIDIPKFIFQSSSQHFILPPTNLPQYNNIRNQNKQNSLKQEQENFQKVNEVIEQKDKQEIQQIGDKQNKRDKKSDKTEKSSNNSEKTGKVPKTQYYKSSDQIAVDQVARVSKISTRNEIVMHQKQQQRVVESERQNQQDVKFMDRVFLAFGCLKRDNKPINQV